MISGNKKELIVLLTRYNSRSFIESIIALLDNEFEINQILQFVKNNPEATKTDIHEKIISIKYKK